MNPETGKPQTDLFFHERRARARGKVRIAGVDEAGRGPLAGPVVAAAVVLPGTRCRLGLADSKILKTAEREELDRELRGLPGIAIGIAVVSVDLIDRLNILRATHAAMRDALAQITPAPDLALVDGLPVPDLPVPAEFIVHGDALVASIAAASIVAKVHRDALMAVLDREYPGYGFARHKGYATPEHLDALGRLGPCPVHRRSFAPVRQAEVDGDPQLEFAFSSSVRRGTTRRDE